ncbi:polysaccharide deacetylase family protein [Myroides sp. LJL116]
MRISTFILPLLYPSLHWSKPKDTKTVYLTFDDGPIPQVTPWVLSILSKYNIKATFFCIGDNISKHPSIFKEIINQGHQVANHTFNHLNGWKTSKFDYLANIEKCQNIMGKTTLINNKLFRPPYGKITRSQIKLLQQNDYKIVMWSNLTRDYDKNLDAEKCYQNTINALSPGNIILFHDSLKAEKNLKHTLPKLIEYLIENQYSFGLI